MSVHKVNSKTNTMQQRTSSRRQHLEWNFGARGRHSEAPAAVWVGEKLTFAFLLVCVRESPPGALGMASFPRGGSIPCCLVGIGLLPSSI